MVGNAHGLRQSSQNAAPPTTSSSRTIAARTIWRHQRRRPDPPVDDALRASREIRRHVPDRRRIDQIREAVAAEEQRSIGLEGDFAQIDEVGIRGLVDFRTDVAIHLVAPRVPHRLELRNLVRVLALADR